MEHLLLVGQTAEERLAILSFLVALRSHDPRKISLEMEFQADMVAAALIARLGLDRGAITTMLKQFPEMHGGAYYPTLANRVEFVESASSDGSPLAAIPREIIDDQGRLDRFLELLDSNLRD